MAKLDALFSSESVEWYTPPATLDLARRVMGGIQLDPCSNDFFTTGADICYTWRDNGKNRSWSSETCFVNPEYGRSISEWVDKYLEEYDKMEQCIMLLPARVDTAWFHSLRYDAICFLKGRIKFISGDLLRYRTFLLGKDYAMQHWDECTGDSAAFPSVLTYKGTMLGKERFIKECQPLGLVMTPGLYL